MKFSWGFHNSPWNFVKVHGVFAKLHGGFRKSWQRFRESCRRGAARGYGHFANPRETQKKSIDMGGLGGRWRGWTPRKMSSNLHGSVTTVHDISQKSMGISSNFMGDFAKVGGGFAKVQSFRAMGDFANLRKTQTLAQMYPARRTVEGRRGDPT